MRLIIENLETERFTLKFSNTVEEEVLRLIKYELNNLQITDFYVHKQKDHFGVNINFSDGTRLAMSHGATSLSVEESLLIENIINLLH